MTMTPFFLELHAAYQSELDDLATDLKGATCCSSACAKSAAKSAFWRR